MNNLVAPRIGKTAKFINSMIKSYFSEHNIPLTKEQLIVLWRLKEEPRPQSFLAMITERDKGSLARLVQSLEKKNYVQKKICKEDSRVNWIEITAEGRAILEDTQPVLWEIFNLLQEGIEEEEIEIAIKVIQKVQENAQKEIEKLDTPHKK
jgi:DNA-binding MarR family transcriptional regulator